MVNYIQKSFHDAFFPPLCQMKVCGYSYKSMWLQTLVMVTVLYMWTSLIVTDKLSIKIIRKKLRVFVLKTSNYGLQVKCELLPIIHTAHLCTKTIIYRRTSKNSVIQNSNFKLQVRLISFPFRKNSIFLISKSGLQWILFNFIFMSWILSKKHDNLSYLLLCRYLHKILNLSLGPCSLKY
jgi:hypothetical protein